MHGACRVVYRTSEFSGNIGYLNSVVGLIKNYQYRTNFQEIVANYSQTWDLLEEYRQQTSFSLFGTSSRSVHIEEVAIIHFFFFLLSRLLLFYQKKRCQGFEILHARQALLTKRRRFNVFWIAPSNPYGVQGSLYGFFCPFTNLLSFKDTETFFRSKQVRISAESDWCYFQLLIPNME